MGWCREVGGALRSWAEVYLKQLWEQKLSPLRLNAGDHCVIIIFLSTQLDYISQFSLQ